MRESSRQESGVVVVVEGGGMVRTWEGLGEAGVRLPCTGNLTRHFVFQSSFSKNKKKECFCWDLTAAWDCAHMHVHLTSFTHIRMHTHSFFSLSQVHPSFRFHIHACPLSFHVTSSHKPFRNELHLVPLVSKMVCTESFLFGSVATFLSSQTSAVMHTDCPCSMAEDDFMTLCLEDALYPTQHQILFVLIAYFL